ncbi:hypothetical protein PF005_g11842 [Phytophthora fragariae]|uniref:Gamma-glutamylcyclotransferase AIG2-like domain-containing protein n=1 Tax=Phytophthora fragariae TaxID=53985 RepID=A0A6A3ZGY4_9STRA|nr:hypothetical protein PF003_g14496 [Phytophthora fragariae]KAE8936609.1 hypothetical protein PF009_g13470 [Phytophthora fragariae]KAE9109785.1 hypothetical protein PF010_g11409 [Phytophthora fragariae]KAE9109871.1 hypothetical protein PF007_g12078 [Phytophthora fragariae]KAE9144003.1 hypothetical protein PF006_g11009 [Phytophthora fragariae]
MVMIIGFGSLLSEASARSTFGDGVRNFRLARVLDYRRVFAHPASIFFQRGIANLQTKEMASLSTEPALGCKFLVSVFDIPESLLPDFYEREEEFKIISAKFQELDGTSGDEALMCTRWSDEEYTAKRGQETFDSKYKAYGLDTIWGWDAQSGILPCRVYLRHCLLAVKKLGQDVYDDFVATTYLGDRSTTIKEYIETNPSIMLERPPPHLVDRYSG